MDSDERRADVIVGVVLALLVAFLACCSAGLVAYAQEPVGCSKGCPPCNVKAEWVDDSWQYDEDQNDGTATITGTERIVYWQASSGYLVTKVCVKTGRQLYFLIPEGEQRWSGSWETCRDISHVVICTETPTAIALTDFSATRDDWANWEYPISMVAVLAGSVGAGIFLAGQSRRTKF